MNRSFLNLFKKKFTREEFVAFARDYLGVDIIFWSVSAPWLRN